MFFYQLLVTVDIRYYFDGLSSVKSSASIGAGSRRTRVANSGVQQNMGLLPHRSPVGRGVRLIRERSFPEHTTGAIGYDGQYSYAARNDPNRATSKAQQYSEGSGPPARSLSEMWEPERTDYRPLGILSDSVFPV